MANRVDLQGRVYGELTAIRAVGVRTWGRDRKKKTQVWQLQCDRGHTCERTLASLRISGQNAKCLECKAELDRREGVR
jgi:sRNA-binding protein